MLNLYAIWKILSALREAPTSLCILLRLVCECHALIVAEIDPIGAAGRGLRCFQEKSTSQRFYRDIPKGANPFLVWSAG